MQGDKKNIQSAYVCSLTLLLFFFVLALPPSLPPSLLLSISFSKHPSHAALAAVKQTSPERHQGGDSTHVEEGGVGGGVEDYCAG